MKFIKKILDNKILISIVMASIIYCVLCLKGILRAYDLLSWLVYAFIIIVCIKADIYNKKYKKNIIIFSVFFSILTVLGETTYSLIDNQT